MNKNALKKILEHPDKDEIISKLIIGQSAKDINEWLVEKYSAVDQKFVIGEKSLKSFQDNYLDIYDMIKKDLSNTKQALALSAEDELALTLQNNPTYKGIMIGTASTELDIRSMLANMIRAVETRVMQYFDASQNNPDDLNTRQDRVMIELMDTLGVNLERWQKLILGAPDQIIQHNVTIQHIDQHVQLLQEAIRETLQAMDVETSLRFMEIFNEKFSKLRPPSEPKQEDADKRLAEAKIINETISKKLGKGDKDGGENE